MPRTIDPKPSPIMAIHFRYEAAMAEYQSIEGADNAARKEDEGKAHKLQTGMRANCNETDALRVAILNQVPDDWTEAMVLQFHISTMMDMHLGCAGSPPEAERQALQTAIDTLLDFLCCEVKADHEKIGPAFQYGAGRAFYQRRYRTGIVED